jgi:hypothetical protein
MFQSVRGEVSPLGSTARTKRLCKKFLREAPTIAVNFCAQHSYDLLPQSKRNSPLEVWQLRNGQQKGAERHRVSNALLLRFEILGR